ncbi:MAG TPA: hypothetical protein DCO72_03850 [Ruminococcus sp.]|nr:hypothetical protein [Ruminococcus sp.]
MNEYQYFFNPPPPAPPPLPQDVEMIDPKNPFHNETEFRNYNSDYGEIVPQIRIPTCKIPLRPNHKESRRIRRYYNIAGGFMLGHFIFSWLLTFILVQVFYLILGAVDSYANGGTLPENYSQIAQNYMNDSSLGIGLNLFCYGLANVLVSWLGCRATKVPIPNLFKTENLTAGKMFSYVCITFFLHLLSENVIVKVMALFDNAGIDVNTADMDMSKDAKYLILSFVYGVIVAPITEELLMRGFFLKTTSRVSQRFGIFITAIFFGLLHQNLPQFILAFIAGSFWGYIVVKHNSIVPSIICHMAANGIVELSGIFDIYGIDLGTTLVNIVYVTLALIGLVLLIRMLIVERLPYAMPEQSERGTRLALTSPLMVIAGVVYISSSVYYVLVQNM